VDNHPLSVFIAFVEYDQTVVALEKKIRENEQQLTIMVEGQYTTQQLLETTERTVTEARKQVTAQELQLCVLEERAKTLKKKLENSSSSKEFFSLTKEVDALAHEQELQENKVLDAWRILDKRTIELVATKKSTAEALQTQEVSTKDQQAQLTDATNQLVVMKQRLQDNAAAVPEEWLQKYMRMRELVSNPVVSVMQDYCSGCCYPVTLNDMSRLHKNALLECKNCFRFLFLESRLSIIKNNAQLPQN
jgi:predicted  nucleic acid-binding Zn-ribbon protein